MQRIHNWKELHLCHPPGERRYIHIDCVLIAKTKPVTRRCFARSIFKSVFSLISAIARSNALPRKLVSSKRSVGSMSGR